MSVEYYYTKNKDGFMGSENRKVRKKKKIDNNNLLPYFMDNHEELPKDYLEDCEKFFKTLTKEKDDSTKKEK